VTVSEPCATCDSDNHEFCTEPTLHRGSWSCCCGARAALDEAVHPEGGYGREVVMVDDVDDEMIALRANLERTRGERDQATAALATVLVWIMNHGGDGADADDVAVLFGRIEPAVRNLAEPTDAVALQYLPTEQ
jgi:hypothetical protein